jgi:hypothetical protein
MNVNDKVDKEAKKTKPKKAKVSNPVSNTISLNGVSVSADVGLSRDKIAITLDQIKDKVLSGA